MPKIKQLLSTDLPEQQLFNPGMLGFRVLLGFALLRTHGVKKLLDIQGTIEHIPDPLGFGGEFSTYIAIFANVFCAGFVAMGFFTRLSSLFILGLTLSGLFLVHFQDPWSVKDVPFMYSIAFGILILMGPGQYSLDYYISKKLEKR